MDLGRQAVGGRGVGRSGLKVRAPASSANLGPGFDAVGLALDLPFVLSEGPDDGLLPCEDGHPAAVAHRAAGGGGGGLWWRSPIPPGRGLGFSGAARVAGSFLAACASGLDEEAARARAFAVAAGLEGHPDNAAASALGGLVVAAGGRLVPVPLGTGIEVVVWWPATEVSTRRARAALPAEVAFADAAFGVGHAALLVAALATGDLDALVVASEDRLHQDRRLAASPDSAVALATFRDAGAAAWLSGSGPAVAAAAVPADAAALAGLSLPPGTVRRLAVDTRGARISD